MTELPDRRSATALHTVCAGPETAPPVVLVHGFTQTHVSWAPVTADLSRDHRVTAVDVPGHGGSDEIRADLTSGAELLGHAGGPAVYVGYSMGGRLALRLALDRPELVSGLILLGSTAGIADPAERATRLLADHALADRIEADGVESFLNGWLAQPLFAGLAIAPADLAARLGNSAQGLASSLRQTGTATMDPPWWTDLPAISVPALVVAGQTDGKFAALGHRLVQAIGTNSHFVTVPGTGHAAHLQDPLAFAALVRAFAVTLS